MERDGFLEAACTAWAFEKARDRVRVFHSFVKKKIWRKPSGKGGLPNWAADAARELKRRSRAPPHPDLVKEPGPVTVAEAAAEYVAGKTRN
jgi:hypothetical protein